MQDTCTRDNPIQEILSLKETKLALNTLNDALPSYGSYQIQGT